MDWKKKGFTLLELLAVITALSILIGIVLPSISKVKRSVISKQIKIQYQRYAQAIVANYNEYGKFPSWLTPNEPVNLSSNIDNFCVTLTGKDKDGITAISNSDLKVYNPYLIEFLELNDTDFNMINNQNTTRDHIRNLFNQSDIYIVISDGSTYIPQSAFSSFESIKEIVPSIGLRERVAIFSIGDNKTSIDVVSWNE